MHSHFTYLRKVLQDLTQVLILPFPFSDTTTYDPCHSHLFCPGQPGDHRRICEHELHCLSVPEQICRICSARVLPQDRLDEVFSYSSLLHLLHGGLIFRGVRVQQADPLFLCHYDAVRIKITISFSVPASSILFQISAYLSEPLEDHRLLHLRVLSQIIGEKGPFHAVKTLPAAHSLIDKPKNFIHLCHILFSAADRPAVPHTAVHVCTSNPCESHQN